MAYYAPFLAALRKAICDAWPEVQNNGTWLVVQIDRFPFEDFAQAGRVPLCVFQVNLAPTDEYGVANRMERGSVAITYIASDTGPQVAETLLLKGETLREHLWDLTEKLDWGQVSDWPSVDASEQNPANDYFLNRNMAFLAVTVTVPVIVGEIE